MNRILTWLLLVGSLGLFLACNTGVRPDILESRTWVLTKYTIAGHTQEVADQATQLQFSGGTISGSTGCNRIGGRYELKNSNLSTDQLLTTKVACPDLMERESELLQALNGGPTLAMDNDNLLMSFADRVLVFRPLPTTGADAQ